jgi:hypothetical protein
VAKGAGTPNSEKVCRKAISVDQIRRAGYGEDPGE